MHLSSPSSITATHPHPPPLLMAGHHHLLVVAHDGEQRQGKETQRERSVRDRE
ncbi:hypothetical protein HanPSC8_Chr01g0022741 [Helianthus annuus]|nr:hypothetical protein HanPSC8_Chr01g0022741 [Helianthus annuus]